MRKNDIFLLSLAAALLLILFSFSFPGTTKADTTIGEGTNVTTPFIFQDTTFTATGSPYIIRQSTELDQGATLTIEPGVTVEFASGANLVIYGKLDGEGTTAQHISFMPLPAESSSEDSSDTFPSPPSYDPYNNDWDIEFDAEQAEPVSTLAYADISGSEGGVVFNNTDAFISDSTVSDSKAGLRISLGSVTLSDVTIANISQQDAIDVFAGTLHADGLTIKGAENAVELFNGSTLDADNLTIDSSGQDAIQGDAIDAYGGSSVELTDSSIGNLGTGAAIGLYGSTAEISASQFAGGQSAAVQVYGNQYIGHSSLTLYGSSIRNFAQAGVALFDPSGIYTLEKNSISGNGDGVDYYDGQLTFRQNSIFGNTQVGFQNEGIASADISNNWWGDPSGPYQSDQNPAGEGNAAATYAGTLEISPWLGDDKQTTPYSNVAFLPGIEGSRLYVQQTFENQLWEPNRNADVEKLYLDDNGESINQDIYTRDVINHVNILPLNFDSPASPDIYDYFLHFMDSLVATGTIAAWQPLPYDWRLSLDDLTEKGTALNVGTDASQPNLSYLSTPAVGSEPYLISQIRQLAATSYTGKVTIVAHSNGGLVAKQLIAMLEQMKEQDGDDLIDKIDQLILVAVPQLGTPDALVSVLHGDGLDYLGGLILDKTVGRKFALTMPTAYNLLPDRQFFSTQATSSQDRTTSPLIVFEDSVKNVFALADDVSQMAGSADSTIDDFQALQYFLIGGSDSRPQAADSDTQSPAVLRSNLLTAADASHVNLDAMAFPGTLAITQIIGWGLDTIDGIDYSATPTCTSKFLQKLHFCSPGYELEHSPIFTSDGDNTVVAASAAALNVPSYFVDLHSYNTAQPFFAINRGHADIMEVQPIQQIVYNLLTHAADSAPLPDFTYEIVPPSENIGDTEEIESDAGLQLDAYDAQGRHTGKITASSTDSDTIAFSEKNIPNSSYREIGDKTYLIIDTSTSSISISSTTSEAPFSVATVKVKGVKIGQSTVKVTKKKSGKETDSETFTDIPVTPSTQGNIEQGSASTSDQLIIDANDDSVPDFSITPSAAFDPLLYLEAMKRTVVSLCIDIDAREQMVNRLDTAIASLQTQAIPNEAEIIEENFVDDGSDVSADSADISPAEAQFIMQGLDDLLKALGL